MQVLDALATAFTRARRQTHDLPDPGPRPSVRCDAWEARYNAWAVGAAGIGAEFRGVGAAFYRPEYAAPAFAADALGNATVARLDPAVRPAGEPVVRRAAALIAILASPLYQPAADIDPAIYITSAARVAQDERVRLHGEYLEVRRELVGLLARSGFAGAAFLDARFRAAADLDPAVLPDAATLVGWVREAKGATSGPVVASTAGPPADQAAPDLEPATSASVPAGVADAAAVLGRTPPEPLYGKLVHALLTADGPTPKRETTKLKSEIYKNKVTFPSSEAFRQVVRQANKHLARVAGGSLRIRSRGKGWVAAVVCPVAVPAPARVANGTRGVREKRA